MYRRGRHACRLRRSGMERPAAVLRARTGARRGSIGRAAAQGRPLSTAAGGRGGRLPTAPRGGGGR